MSASIDKRIVEMQFDNKQFESGIQTSVKSLEQLKKGLDLEKTAKGLSGLEKAGRFFNLSGISNGVSVISSRFSAMGIVGMTALQNITNSAYNCGKRMVSALTIDPVKTGFAEYETQINAVQTILANTSDEMKAKGLDEQGRLDLVNEKLDELNNYADKTIYNFTEMTRNIGTFTAAGVDLETSVSSIQGIANLAAVSGSTSQQASTAMYQLSQALSSGTVKLMDWNSVVNAGMGGEVFQKALKRTAQVMGVTGEEAKEMFEKLENGDVTFRDSLSSGWLSSDILNKTLGQLSMDFEKLSKNITMDEKRLAEKQALIAQGYAESEAENLVKIAAAKEIKKSELLGEGYSSAQADEIIELAETANDAATKVKTFTQLFDTMKEAAQSGWTETWEKIVGDFGEAKGMLTQVSKHFGDIIGASANARNAMLDEWRTAGGRGALVNSFWNIINAIENVVKTFKSSFAEFFPPATGEQLANITKKISDLTAKIKAATENGELMGKVSRIFRGAAAALDIVRTAAGWAWDGFKKLLGMTEGAAGGFLDFVAGIGDFVVGLRDSIKNSKTFQGILDGLGTAASSVRDLVVGGIKTVGSFFVNLWNKVKATGIFTKVGDWFQSFIGKIPEFIGKIGDWGRSIIDWVKNSETLKTAWNNIKGFFEPIVDGIAKFGGKLWEAIQNFFGADTSGEGSLWDRMKARFTAFGTKIGEWFESVKPKLAEAWANVKAFVSNLFTEVVPEFFANLKMKAITKWPWLDKVFSFFEESWNKVKEVCGPTVRKIKQLGVQLWEGIKNLFGGNKAPKEGELTFGESFMNIVTGAWEKIKTFFSTFVTTTIPNWFDKLDGINWGTVLKAALGLSTLWKIVSMASGFQKMGQGLKSLGSGLKGVGEMLGGINKDGLTITKVFKKKDSFATSLLKVAAAIGILVASIVVLANMEAGKAWKGIGLLTLIAGELLVITALFKKIDANGDALLKAAGAVALLVIPIYLLGNMDTGMALKGILGVGLILTELAFFMKIAGSGMKGKQSFLGLAIAVNLLVFAVKGLGNIDTGAALQGVIGLGLIMLELSLFMNKTNTKKIGGMISMAIAMNLLVRAVKKMGSLNTKTIIKGVLGLGGIMAAFALLINASKGMKFGSALLMLLTMAGSMILFVEMFKQVEGMNMDNMLKFATSLATVMLSLSVAMKVISMIPISGALSGLAGFAILIVGVGALVAALGWLQSEWGGLTDFLESGGNILGQIGRALGKFVGGIAGGFMEGMNLPQIGTDLSNFMTNAQGFITGAKNIDGATISGVTALSGAILAIGGTEFLNALVSLFTGENPVTKFSKDIVTLGQALTSYAFAVLPMALVPTAVLDRSVAVATALAGVAGQIPTTGGIVGLITGIGDLGTFSTNIKSLGTGLADFATEISAIDDSAFNQTKIDAVIAVATGLASLESNLEGQGGLEDAIEGVKSLSKFSDGMDPFGAGLNDFISQVKLIEYDPKTDGEKMTAVIDIGSKLAELEKNLEAQGGWADAIEGVKSLSTFGNEMPDFATGLNSFIAQISLLDDTKYDGGKIEKALAVATAINELNKNLPSTDGWLQGIIGTQDLGLFSENIKKVGEALAAFSTSVSGATVNKAENAVSALDVIRTFTSTLDADDGLWQNIGKFFGGSKENTLLGYAENMRTVGTDLNTFSTQIEAVKISNINKASEVIGAIGTFISGLTASGSVFEAIGSFFAGSQGNTLISLSGNMATLGTNIGILAAGIENIDVTATNFEGAKVLFDNFKKFNDTVATYGDIEYSTQMSTLIWVLDDFGASLALFQTNLGTANVTSLATAASIIETLVNLAGSASTIDPANVTVIGSVLEEYGKISLQGFVTGFTNASGDAVLAVNGLISQITVEIQNDATVSDAVSALSRTGVSALRGTWINWKTAGSYLGSGIANGIGSMAGRIRSAATNAAAGAIRAIQIKWSIHSPSKVGEELGEYWDLGIARGMDKYAKLIDQSSANIGTNAINSARSALNNLSYLTEDIGSEPTIRPVMDLTDITSGFQTIDGLFNSERTMNSNLFGGLSSIRNARSMTSDQGRIAYQSDNREVVAELAKLSKQLDELSAAVSNMQVVLDTGVLVGQTSAQMDSQLGTLASRRGRGN